MKKIIVITTEKYPTHGIFTLIKYFVLSLNSCNDFKKKFKLEIFIFNESFLMKIKKIIYNFFLIFKNIFFYQNNRIHKFSYPSKKFVNEFMGLKKNVFYV